MTKLGDTINNDLYPLITVNMNIAIRNHLIHHSENWSEQADILTLFWLQALLSVISEP